MVFRRLPVAVLLGVVLSVFATPAAIAAGHWQWPIEGPILRGYDPPDSPYESGHRGIDIGAPAGTAVRGRDTGGSISARRLEQLFAHPSPGR